MWEYLQIKDKGMVNNYLGTPEVEMRWDLTKDLTSVSSMIEANKASLRWKLQAVTGILNKKINTGKLDKTQAEWLVKEYDGKLKGAVSEARKNWDRDVESLINTLDGIIASSSLKANPEHVVANKNSNPDTNPLLSFVKQNTQPGKALGNRVPDGIK